MEKRHTLLEVADVARALALSPAMIRVHADRGAIPIAAVTPRGGRLFEVDAVETFRRERERRRAGR